MFARNRRAVRNMLVLAVIMGSLLVAAEARTADYGCVSTSQCVKMEKIIRAWFPNNVENTMICIARRESGLNPKATNWSDQHSTGRGSYGLFQLGHLHGVRSTSGITGVGYDLTRGNVYRFWNPIVNVRTALRLYRGSGLAPWGGGC